MKKFTVLDLIDLDLEDHNALHVRCIGGRKGLIREITVP
ncbi:MAG: HPr kinase/phosphorylase, partial [Spirochaetales bacterium]